MNANHSASLKSNLGFSLFRSIEVLHKVSPDCRKSWDQLPTDLLERILRQGRTYGVQMLLNLQLVSKAWKAATPRAFSGHLSIKIQHGKATKFARICRDLPSISSLEIQSQQEAFDLSPIFSSCSGLSSLVLGHNTTSRRSNYLALDAALLPSGLRHLEIDHWTFDITHLQHFRSVGITSLHIGQTENSLADFNELLQHLRGLKVEKSFSSILLSISRSRRSGFCNVNSSYTWLYIKDSFSASISSLLRSFATLRFIMPIKVFWSRQCTCPSSD